MVIVTLSSALGPSTCAVGLVLFENVVPVSIVSVSVLGVPRKSFCARARRLVISMVVGLSCSSTVNPRTVIVWVPGAVVAGRVVAVDDPWP